MKKRHLPRLLLLAAFLLASAAALWAVAGFERTLARGQAVLIELAPVDPRSLMQGDYMALRFAIDDHLPHPAGDDGTRPPRFAYVALDDAGRATFRALGNDLPAPAGQVALRIRQRDGRLSVGPNAFFFQEGSADIFEGARWGEFRVDGDGNALLTHLRGDSLQRLGAQTR